MFVVLVDKGVVSVFSSLVAAGPETEHLKIPIAVAKIVLPVGFVSSEKRKNRSRIATYVVPSDTEIEFLSVRTLADVLAGTVEFT